MKVFETFVKLWNGGLNPVTADPKQLGEQRTFSAIAFVLIPTSLVLITSNLIYPETNFTRVGFIAGVMVTGIAGLYVQAYKGWQRLAAVSIVVRSGFPR